MDLDFLFLACGSLSRISTSRLSPDEEAGRSRWLGLLAFVRRFSVEPPNLLLILTKGGLSELDLLYMASRSGRLRSEVGLQLLRASYPRPRSDPCSGMSSSWYPWPKGCGLGLGFRYCVMRGMTRGGLWSLLYTAHSSGVIHGVNRSSSALSKSPTEDAFA